MSEGKYKLAQDGEASHPSLWLLIILFVFCFILYLFCFVFAFIIKKERSRTLHYLQAGTLMMVDRRADFVGQGKPVFYEWEGYPQLLVLSMELSIK